MIINRFEIMGINIPDSTKSEIFHDDGYVSSFNEHYKALCLDYGYPEADLNNDGGGLTVRFARETIKDGSPVRETHFHIFYKNLASPISNLSNRAHEECHVIHGMNLTRNLFSEHDRLWIANDINRTFFPGFVLEELICEIGGFLALEKRGITIPQITSDLDTDATFKARARNCYDYFSTRDELYLERLYEQVREMHLKHRSQTKG